MKTQGEEMSDAISLVEEDDVEEEDACEASKSDEKTNGQVAAGFLERWLPGALGGSGSNWTGVQDWHYFLQLRHGTSKDSHNEILEFQRQRVSAEGSTN